MYSPCVNVMQILLQLFPLLFLGNIVIARQIKQQTKGEHSRVTRLCYVMKEKHYKAKTLPISVKLIESNRREICVHTLLLSFL